MSVHNKNVIKLARLLAWVVLSGLVCIPAWSDSSTTARGIELAVQRVAEACPAETLAPGVDGHTSLASAELYEFIIEKPLGSIERPVLLLKNPFYATIALRLPASDGWLFTTPPGQSNERVWPAAMTIVPTSHLALGDRILMCIRGVLPLGTEARLLPEHDLPAYVLRGVRLSSTIQGSMLALVLVAFGMAFTFRTKVFLGMAGGLGCTLVYLLATSGDLLDYSFGAYLARTLPVQRLGGIGASILLLWSLAHYIDLKDRHQRICRFLHLCLGLLGVIFVVSMLPTPLRFMPLSIVSNGLMVIGLFTVLLIAIKDARLGHTPSRLLLWSWTPLTFVATWASLVLSVPQLEARFLGGLDSLYLALSLSIIYSCSFLLAGMGTQVSELSAQRDFATRQARTDALTGVLSRGALLERVGKVWDERLGYQRPPSLLFIDLDHFKKINDNFGHAIGDRALKISAQRIEKNLREQDFVGRYGGEEFVAIVENLDRSAACDIAERIRKDIENSGQPLEAGLPPLTLSIGVAVLDPKVDGSHESWLRRADAVLYRAKSAGRNCIDCDGSTVATA